MRQKQPPGRATEQRRGMPLPGYKAGTKAKAGTAAKALPSVFGWIGMRL